MTKRLEELVELALKKELTDETRTELVKILFITNDGDIYLSNLQLQDFNGILYQYSQKVGGDLYQNFQKVQGNLYQYNQTVSGDLSQCYQTVKGYGIIGNNNFAGIKETINGEDKIVKEIDPYKDMSKAELIEELKKLKGGQNA